MDWQPQVHGDPLSRSLSGVEANGPASGVPLASTPLSQRNPDTAQTTEPKAWPFQPDVDGREPKPGIAGVPPAFTPCSFN